MLKIFRALGIAALLVTGGLSAAAPVQSGPVSVAVVPETKAIAPGQPFWVAVHFDMDEGWHTYWKNPGDSGMAPALDWDLPAGFKITAVHWPTPERFEEDSVVGYGYEGSAILLVQIEPPKALEMGQDVELGLNATWIACKDSCMPGAVAQKLSLPVGKGEAADNVAFFEKAREKLPQAAAAVSIAREGGQVVLKMKQPDKVSEVTHAYFFPEDDGVVDYSAAQRLSKSGADVALSFPTQMNGKVPVRGVVVLHGDGDPVAYAVDGAAKNPLGKLALAFFFAFVGGMILNLMPCVLPVISLKLMSFVNMAGSSRSQLLRHGFIFTLGVVVSYWVLAGLLLVLRASGEGLGWGFQLQEPGFVLALVMILFLLGLSMAGLFEVGTSLSAVGGKTHKKEGFWGTFLGGVLATVVATPCTGPLLAPALGFAMTLPAATALAIFTVMGLGMAAPYLLLSAFPKLVERMPKPGPWMITFKQVMGFLMFATVLWLLWVFQAQVQSGFALLEVLAALLVLSVGAWIYGRWGTPIKKKRVRRIAYAIAAGVAALSVVVGVHATKAEGTNQIEHAELATLWEPWDADRFEQLRSEGTPVFVDFTAKWCLICQANKVPMHNAEVIEKFKEKGVVLMEADWTKRDPSITKQLEKFGRSGVPLYVLYSDKDEPEILPQLLTSGTILTHLENLD